MKTNPFIGLFCILLGHSFINALAARSEISWMLEESKRPQFSGQIKNISVAVGRDASFICNVKNLGNFRLGWVKSDTKAIQAIHDTVITYNPRVEVSGDFKSTFILTIKGIKEEDSGDYMCQVNTDPMLSQAATLNVMVPPDIDMTLTTPDLELREGDTAKLRCFGKGKPKPRIGWRREDGKTIRFKTVKGVGTSKRFNGSILLIPRVTEEDMGAYLCIAKNNAPPAVSKRIYLHVQFPPRIESSGQLVRATLGHKLILNCNVKGFPKPLIYWIHNGIMIGDKSTRELDILETTISGYEFLSSLTIRNASAEHMGKFRCVAKNSLGDDDMHTRIYMAPSPPTSPSPTSSSYSKASQYENGVLDGPSDKNSIDLKDDRMDITKYDTFSFDRRRVKKKNRRKSNPPQHSGINYYYVHFKFIILHVIFFVLKL